MIRRTSLNEIKRNFEFFPAVALLGARQTGKTTLAKEFASKYAKGSIYLDIELPSHYQRLKTDAEAYFSKYSDRLIIIDEVQRMPELFSMLRAMIDKNRKPKQFLLLGSSSPSLVKGVSESLAGRVSYVDLGGINYNEAQAYKIDVDTHWFRGGFPIPLLAKNDKATSQWYVNFIRSYVEKDFSDLFGVDFSPVTMRNFWQMLAGNNGGLFQMENYSKSLGVSAPTVKRYLHFLEAAFMVTRLNPWSMNIGKRLVKSPKIYFRDTGLLHNMNRIYSHDELFGSISVGYSWESYVIEQIRQLRNGNIDLYYYRTHQGAEADLVLVKGSKPIAAIEIKISTSPSVSKGFFQSIEDLKTKKNFVIIPSGDSFQIKNNVECVPLGKFLKEYLPEIH